MEEVTTHVSDKEALFLFHLNLFYFTHNAFRVRFSTAGQLRNFGLGAGLLGLGAYTAASVLSEQKDDSMGKRKNDVHPWPPQDKLEVCEETLVSKVKSSPEETESQD